MKIDLNYLICTSSSNRTKFMNLCRLNTLDQGCVIISINRLVDHLNMNWLFDYSIINRLFVGSSLNNHSLTQNNRIIDIFFYFK